MKAIFHEFGLTFASFFQKREIGLAIAFMLYKLRSHVGENDLLLFTYNHGILKLWPSTGTSGIGLRNS